MANGYSLRDVLLNGSSVTLGASETDTVVSNTFSLSAADSLEFKVRIKTSSTTVTTAITANLQHQWEESEGFADVGNQAQVSITGDGWFEFKMSVHNSTDEAQLPIAPLGRVVVSSGTSDAVTIDKVLITRRY